MENLAVVFGRLAVHCGPEVAAQSGSFLFNWAKSLQLQPCACCEKIKINTHIMVFFFLYFPSQVAAHDEQIDAFLGFCHVIVLQPSIALLHFTPVCYTIVSAPKEVSEQARAYVESLVYMIPNSSTPGTGMP